MFEPTLIEILFFMFFALSGMIIAIRMKQPYVIWLLLFGMLAGPHALGLVTNENLIETLFEIGAILLLFTVGIEFSISKLLRFGFRAVVITFFKMMVLFFFGYELSLYLGLGLTNALFIGAMISITSTSVMYKIALEKGTLKDPIIPLLISMLIVEDIVAVAALTFFSSLGSGTPTSEDKLYSLIISLGLLGAFYVFVWRHASQALTKLTTKFNDEALIFVSFSFCLVMAYIANLIGLSAAIGAFLAGSIISSLPNSRNIEKTIKPLLLTFSAFFFLSFGMQVDPRAVIENFAIAAAITAIFIIVCFSAVFALVYSTGTGGRKSLLAASSMVVIGEFSLIIASLASGESRTLLLSIGSFGVIATTIISSILLDRRREIEKFVDNNAPARAKNALRAFAIYMTGIVRDFSPRGAFWRISKICWSCASTKVAKIILVLIFVWIARMLSLRLFESEGISASQISGAVAIIGAIAIIYYIVGIIADIKPILDSLSRAIARHKKTAKVETRILKDILLATLFLLIALTLPDIVAHLKLPAFFSLSDELAFLIAFAFAWDIVLSANEMKKE